MTGAEESLLLIERNGRKKSIKGSNLDLLIQNDILLINRDKKVQKIRWVDTSTLTTIQDTDLFACWKDGTNYHMTGVTFKELYIPKVQITQWEWPSGTEKYGAWMTGYWTTKNAERLEKEGFKVYANFSGDTASGSETWRFYPSETGYQSMTGKAYSKYDDSTVSTQAWIWVTGLSINPSTIFDYVTNGKIGGAFRPKVNIPNEDKIYAATETEMFTTWRLIGLTKGNEEASFGSGNSNQINETTDREPRVHFKKKTKNGAITLQCEALNSDNYERSRPEIKFTVG